MTRRPPRLYFSFRSPYSWMAVEQLRRSVPDLLTRLDVFPYWDPDPVTERALHAQHAQLVYQQMSKAKHLYVLADTKRMAKRLGLTMAWPIDVDPWWELPHLAWLAARRTNCEERCYDALIAARWQRGENICERDVLGRVLADAGLDEQLLLAAATDPQIMAEGVRCLLASWQDDVFGVPYLMVGRQRFWGVDRVDQFLEAFQAAETHQTSETPPGVQAVPESARVAVPVGAYDRDTAGGCG